MLLQKVKERFRRGFLSVPLHISYFGSYCYIPIFLVDVDSYENLLSFERNFVSLHPGTVLIVYISCLLGSYKDTIQLLSYQLFAQTNYYRTNFLLRKL